MNIKDSKFLDKNTYNYIIISDKSITYKSNVDYRTIPTGFSFSKSLKILPDEEVISEAIRHYLRNTRVMSIIDKDEYKNRPCMTLNGTRKLRTYVPINKDVQKELLKKYESDRIKTINEEEYDSVHITIRNNWRECYPYREDENSKKQSLSVVLCSNDGVIEQRELEFLKELITFLMGSNIGKYKVFHEMKFGHNRWIGNGISNINHDIVCSIDAEKIVYDIWFNQYCIKTYQDNNQITIEEYVKKLNYN